MASSPESNFPSGWGVTPPAFCMTVPEVTVCTPGSIWCQVTVVPALTVSAAGLYAISLRFTESPPAAAPVVVVVAFGFAPDDEDDDVLDDPHALSAATTATRIRLNS